MSRASSREVWVGLVLVAAVAALLGLMGLARGGPGFLSQRRTIDVVFRDAQGIRVGCPVRIAGLDAGRVEGIDLAEVDGALRAKVQIAVPTEIAAKLRHDVKITVRASLTGQSCINIVSSGQSAVALVPGQVVTGIETSIFDPIMEQVGLGPVERNHLSHTIAEVRETVDAAGPRLRQILASLQESADDFRETAETVRPAVVATARRIDEAAPKVEAVMRKIDSVLAQVDGVVAENRSNVHSTIASLSDLTATAQDIAARDRKKVEDLLDGLNGTRARADRVLYQADQLASQGASMLAKNRSDIERTVANVRDATDYGDKLVQKIFSNPFYLSPFYKPSREDVRAQGAYDTTQNFMRGAKELSDAVTTLQAMQAKPLSPTERQAYNDLYRRAVELTNQLNQLPRQMAESIESSRTRK